MREEGEYIPPHLWGPNGAYPRLEVVQRHSWVGIAWSSGLFSLRVGKLVLQRNERNTDCHREREGRTYFRCEWFWMVMWTSGKWKMGWCCVSTRPQGGSIDQKWGVGWCIFVAFIKNFYSMTCSNIVRLRISIEKLNNLLPREPFLMREGSGDVRTTLASNMAMP